MSVRAAGTFAAGLYIVLNHLVKHAVVVIGVCLLLVGMLLFRRVMATRSAAGFAPVMHPGGGAD